MDVAEVVARARAAQAAIADWDAGPGRRAARPRSRTPSPARTAPRSSPGWRSTRPASATTTTRSPRSSAACSACSSDLREHADRRHRRGGPRTRPGQDREAGGRRRRPRPDDRSRRDPAREGAVRARRAQRDRLRRRTRAASAPPSRRRVTCARRASRSVRRPTWSRCCPRPKIAHTTELMQPGRPHRRHRRRRDGQGGVQLRHPGLRRRRRQRRPCRRRDRGPRGRRGAIAAGKTFDYATSCLADNSVVVHDAVYDDLLRGCTAAAATSARRGEGSAAGRDVARRRATSRRPTSSPSRRRHIAGLAGIDVPDGDDLPHRRGGRRRATTTRSAARSSPSCSRSTATPAASRTRSAQVNAITGYQGLGHTCGIHTSERRPRRRPRLRHPDGPGAGQPEPQRGCRQRAQRPAVHAQPVAAAPGAARSPPRTSTPGTSST